MWSNIAICCAVMLFCASKADTSDLSAVCLHKMLQCIPHSNSTTDNLQDMCRSGASQDKFAVQLDCTLGALETSECRGDTLARTIGMGDLDAERLQGAVDYLCSEMDGILGAIACVIQNQAEFGACAHTVTEKFTEELSDEQNDQLRGTACRFASGVFNCLDVKSIPSCLDLTSLRTFLQKLLPPQCDAASGIVLSTLLITASLYIHILLHQ